LFLGISLQVLLGVFNVILQLPMANAVLHNGVALLILMMAVLSLVWLPSKESIA
jgi:heme A synthase